MKADSTGARQIYQLASIIGRYWSIADISFWRHARRVILILKFPTEMTVSLHYCYFGQYCLLLNLSK